MEINWRRLAVALGASFAIMIGVPLVFAAMGYTPSWPWSYLYFLGIMVYGVLLGGAFKSRRKGQVPSDAQGP